ncbi:HEPN domain-containing protein [Candidatus Marsarchaeota archaeon]|nr:HEPN domain-containing protein [Candidatus Marsarchaeota archaeon]
MSELGECIEKGLLKKMPESRQAAERSIVKARAWLIEANGALKAGIYSTCLLAAYEAMFHAARAILIKDGYRERSHYCIARYIDEIYVKKGLLKASIIHIIDSYRELRHDTAYGIENIAEKVDAAEAIVNAGIVIEAIEKLVK